MDEMDFLGISIHERQCAAALMRDGQIVATAIEERPTLNEAGPFLPTRAIEYCLSQGGHQNLRNIHGVGLQASRSLNWGDLVRESIENERGFFAMLKALPVNLRDEVAYRLEVRRELHSLEGEDVGEGSQVLYVSAEAALVSGLYSTQAHRDVAILKLDNPLEEGATGLWAVQGGVKTAAWEKDFPHSWDLLLRNLATFCGFRGRLGERQFVDLAVYGEPRFLEVLRSEVLDLKPDGNYQIEMSHLSEHPQVEDEFSGLQRLFMGPMRNPSAPITSREIDLAQSLVTLAREFASRLGKTVKDQLRLDRILVRGQGPVAEIVKQRLQRSRRFTQIAMPSETDEVLVQAAGAAIEVSQKLTGNVSPSQAGDHALLNTRPESRFARFSQRPALRELAPS